jgi:tetratricopeptide (TPR) repeat protein
MPAHIYLRLGRYRESIDVNRDAVAADEAFLAQAGEAASDIYRYGYFPHNVHFMMASAQMAGLKADTLAAAGKLGAMTSEKASREMPWMQHIMTAPYAAHAQFGEAEVVLALPPPNDDLPFVKGIWRYARGVAFAALGDEAAALREADAIKILAEKEEMNRLEALNLPARPVLNIARLVVEARAAQAKGDFVTAEGLLREAIGLQDALPYTEPPYWHYPLCQTLGAVALQAGREREAAQAFSEALRKTPRNGWALWGLWQAQKAGGDPKASETRAAFEKAWLGDQALLRLNRL